MSQFEGNAFFWENDVEKIDFSESDLSNKIILFSRENFDGDLSDGEIAEFLKNGVTAIVTQNFNKSFRQRLFSKGILAVEINKKDLADIFANFASKDATATILLADEVFAKIKLISGSFSKSYQFRLDATEKEIFGC